MSISASTNYMSSSSIEAWMEQKTEDLYGSMRGAMDESNTRADAEAALNDIKAKMANAAKDGSDTADLQQEIKDTLDKYKDIPAVVSVLTPLDTDLSARTAAAEAAAHQPVHLTYSGGRNPVVYQPATGDPEPVKLSQDDSDRYGKQISDVVDDLGKQDQLGLINIQEFNSQINQTKQIASALMDAADKAANAIISHIS